MAVVLIMAMSSCRSSKKQVLYLQDAVYEQPVEAQPINPILIRPHDELLINVSSRDPKLAQLFNLQTGTTQTNSTTIRPRLTYLVDEEGDIQFPMIGKLHVAGMNRIQVANLIANKLREDNLLKDPTVSVNFYNLHFSVLGEVTRPGEYAIDRDQLTLFEALSLAGDLTIYGERDKVYVVREENGVRNIHRVDLKSIATFDSPAYYIQQNDVIIVEPNGMKTGQRNANENSLKSISMWMSIITFITTMVVLFVK